MGQILVFYLSYQKEWLYARTRANYTANLNYVLLRKPAALKKEREICFRHAILEGMQMS